MDRIEALRLLCRIAERGSFSAAARDVKIKQSTASKWVAELEREFGTTLVERTTRQLRISRDGERVLEHARELLRVFDGMTAELGQKSAEPHGRLRVSIPVVFGRLFVLPAVADYLKRHPEVSVDVVMSDRYVNLVEEGFDLAIRVGARLDTSAKGRKLADGRRVLVAAPAYLRARGVPREPAGLREHDCLVHAELDTRVVWRFGVAGGRTTPVSVRGRCSINNSEAVLQLACAGLGVALLAEWLVADELRRGRLVALLETFPTPPAPVFALTPPGPVASPLARSLSDHLALALRARLG
jgi:molybdate transport repressor ModE-like protein